MRLDPSYLHFITKQELRILVAIQIGMKNHQYVPLQLISSIGNLRSGETFRTIKKLLKNKLVVHVGKKYDGYKLTYLGYDYLALHTFLKRGTLKDVICKIGVGKQSDIYKCQMPDGSHVVLKLTRLGRRSFKTIKNNREYLQGRNNYNWLYLSRLSSIREFSFMQVLHEDGFPTPKPIDTNRHAIVMSLIDGDPLCHIKKIGEQCSVKEIFKVSLALAEKFVSRGLIHGDFNQFNLMINSEGKLTVIDFPQCISANHINADEYFNRDIECLYTFFEKMMKKCQREEEDGKVYVNENDVGFDVASIPMPMLQNIQIVKRLDHEVKAKGHFKLSEEKQLEDFMKEWNQVRKEEIEGGIGEEGEESSDEEEENEEGEEEVEGEVDEEEGKIQEKQFEIKEDIEKIQQIKIQSIQKNNEIPSKMTEQQQIGDDDLNQLMNQLKQLQTNQQEHKIKDSEKPDENQSESSSSEDNNDNEDSESQMREQWKGLTAYEIRQKIKEQKRLERQKKKEEMSTNEYIKNALGRGKKNKRKEKEIIPKGNFGAKKRAQNNAQKIKDGLQMGW